MIFDSFTQNFITTTKPREFIKPKLIKKVSQKSFTHPYLGFLAPTGKNFMTI